MAPGISCVVIRVIINNPDYADAFFWPGFVIAGTGINVLRTLVRRQDMIEENVRRLEKKQAKRQATEQPAEIEPPRPEDEDE